MQAIQGISPIAVEETAKPVTYDFNSSNATDVAVMPMDFAIKILNGWINTMYKASVHDIRESFIYELNTCKDIDSLLYVSQQFIFERQIIEDVKQGDFSRYEVK